MSDSTAFHLFGGIAQELHQAGRTMRKLQDILGEFRVDGSDGPAEGIAFLIHDPCGTGPMISPNDRLPHILDYALRHECPEAKR